MKRSQRRVSGKTAPKTGNRIRLIAALILAVSAAGFIAIEWNDSISGELVARFSGSDCNLNYSPGSDAAQACGSDAESAVVQNLAANPHADSEKPHPTNNTQSQLGKSLRNVRPSESRAWIGNQSGSDALRPGYTMAELCQAGLDGREFRCRTGSYDDTLNTVTTSAPSEVTSRHSISGHVLTAAGAGVNGVKIVASPERLNGERNSAAGSLRFWTVTDSFGAYALNGLPDGEYRVRSSAHDSYQSTHISVRAGVTYADLVVSRNFSAVVEGQVVGSVGEALEGVTVLPVLLGQPSVLTGNDGRFRLPITLKPSVESFALRFQRPGYREQTDTVNLKRLAASSSAHIEIVMHPVESWTSLEGIVRADSGEPLPGRTVELRHRSAQQTYTSITDSRGGFAYSIVEAPAEYDLIVFGGADHKDYQRSIHVTPEIDELDVVVEAYEFGEVTGQLVNLNGVPVPNFDLVLRNTASRMPNILVSTDRLGNFDIPAAPAGELVMASQSTPSILVRGLRLRAGDKLHLPLVLDWGEHEIRGVVVDAYGNPVPASRIVLQWSHAADGVTTSATRRTAADTQGQFVFSDLGPGPHSLQVNAPGFGTTNVEHDLSRQGYDLTVRLN